MWAQLEIWRVQDGQFPELAVGGVWETRLEVGTDDVEEVPPETPLGIELVEGPLSSPGPRYELVGQVGKDSVIGTFLDVGEFPVAPLSLSNWQVGTFLRLRSSLWGSQCLFSEPPDPLIRSWRVCQLFIRFARAVPDSEPRSWRSDLSDVKFRSIERMRMWDDATGPIGPGPMSPLDDGPRSSDYLLEVEPLV